MFLSELSAAQKSDLGLFETQLDAKGWDLEPNFSLLRSGTSVSPEGSADFERGSVQLSTDFFVDDRTFDLLIVDQATRRSFRIVPGESIEPYLRWLTSVQDRIDLMNFAPLLKELIPAVKEVWYVSREGRRRLGVADS